MGTYDGGRDWNQKPQCDGPKRQGIANGACEDDDGKQQPTNTGSGAVRNGPGASERRCGVAADAIVDSAKDVPQDDKARGGEHAPIRRLRRKATQNECPLNEYGDRCTNDGGECNCNRRPQRYCTPAKGRGCRDVKMGIGWHTVGIIRSRPNVTKLTGGPLGRAQRPHAGRPC